MLGIFRSLLRRVEYIIYQSEGILQHLRNNPAQQTTTNLKRRIGINLTQPRSTIPINQIIQPKQLKPNPPPSPNQSPITNSMTNIPRNPSNFGNNIPIKIKRSIIQTIFIHIPIGQLIRRFIFVIIRHILLYCIVCQMHTLWYPLQCKFLWCSTDITLLIHVKFKNLTHLNT